MDADSLCRTSARYVYSEKIKDRRRSLFPQDKNDNSDLDHMSPLSSDSECANNEELSKINIATSASTKYIQNVLSTPTNRNYAPSEQSMSPLYLSPHTNTPNDKTLTFSISPTKQLKTPNVSNVINSDGIPKLSRKSIDLHSLLSPTHSKSKVRTSLFPDIEVSLAPKQFYPKTDSYKRSENRTVYKDVKQPKLSTMKKNHSKIKRRLLGQINAGVRHKIKKPKERNLAHKLSNVSLAKIKTFKNEKTINAEFGKYFEDLSEWNKTKQIKLIQQTPSEATDTRKRLNDETNDIISKKPKLDENQSLESIDEDEDIDNLPNINEIINSLDDTNEGDKENNSNNTELVEEMLLSPTSEMCNMTSVMKIESPRKNKNLNLIFQNMSENSESQQSTQKDGDTEGNSKYFPIFYPNHKTAVKRTKNSLEMEGSRRKRLKISSNQMILDAGQKRFGLTECAECNYVYHASDPKDEAMHDDHHNATTILRFPGWKNEHIVENLPNGARIIQIIPGDSKIWLEKAKKVIEVINRQLGHYEMATDSKVFLYIMHKQIIGLLVAEKISEGFKLITADSEIDMCSTSPSSTKCGVSRLWVSPQFRKQGIATKLMDSLKSHFLTNQKLDNSDIAFGSPTKEGKLFAVKYFKTPHFLTY